jgi:hypothetical protein
VVNDPLSANRGSRVPVLRASCCVVTRTWFKHIVNHITAIIEITGALNIELRAGPALS